MGNYSRDTFDRLKHYVNVRLQQGVPIVDADWNELQDIRKHELETFLKWFVGNGVPLGNDGFAIGAVADGNDFSIAAGHCLVEGWTVVNENVVRYQEQTEVPPLVTPSSDRTDTVYLDVWEREVNAEHDPVIVNPGIGIETCVRTRREWVVRVAEGATELPSPTPGHVFYPLARLDRKKDQDVIDVVTDLRHTGLTLAGKLDRAGDRITGDLMIDKELSFGAKTRQMINLWGTDYSIGVQACTQYFRSASNFAWYKGGTHHDYEFNPGGGSVQMVIDATGNVGIGTSHPFAKLTVDNLSADTAWNTAVFRKRPVGPHVSHIHHGSTGDWYIRSANSTGKVVIQDSGGNVGIGTPNPRYPLEVHGTVEVFGSINAIENRINTYTLHVHGPDPTPASGHATILLHHTGIIWHQLRYNSGNLFLERTPSVGHSTDTPNFYVGGAIWARDFNLSGGDYAEYFESLNGKEIPAGTAVILDGDKIRSAQKGETPIGIISANPGIVGGAYREWPGKFLRDELGQPIMEQCEEEVIAPKKEKVIRERQKAERKTVEEEVTRTQIVVEDGKYLQKEITETVSREVEEPVFEEVDLYDATGKTVIGKHRVPVMETYEEEIDVLDDDGRTVLERTGKFETKERPKLNPDYSESKEYVPRAERPEWNCVGLLGKLPLRKGQPVAESWIKMKDLSDEVELWLVK